MECSSSSETESLALVPKQPTSSTTQHRHGRSWPSKKGGVALEACYYIEPSSSDGSSAECHASSCTGGVGRSKSLTNEDLQELKGCLDLGFGFSYDDIPELCTTLPALELCYSMTQRFLDDHLQQQRSIPPKPTSFSFGEATATAAPAPPVVANWKFSSPGDDPEEVKARLKYWAQAVACTVRLCS